MCSQNFFFGIRSGYIIFKVFFAVALPETNIAPENGRLEY